MEYANIFSNGQYQVQQIDPVYTGDTLSQAGNYGPGYIGFSYNTLDPFAKGITYFTRWERLSGIKISHALIVINEFECIESVLARGVIVSPLSKYLSGNHRKVFFRKPLDLDVELAKGIIQSAREKVNQPFENRLILADLIVGSPLGHYLNQKSDHQFAVKLNAFLDDHRGWICSELAASCLKEQSDWHCHDKGILAEPANIITPQALFEDQTVFSSWKK